MPRLQSPPSIHQCDIVQLRGPDRLRRVVVVSGDAFQASGLVLIAPIIERRQSVSNVELLIDAHTVVSLSGLRPVSVDRVTKIVGRIEPAHLREIFRDLDVACNR